MRKFPDLPPKRTVSYTDKVTVRIDPETKWVLNKANETRRVSDGLREMITEWAKELKRELRLGDFKKE